jgi:outer membrane lipoprotein-sorting protein
MNMKILFAVMTIGFSSAALAMDGPKVEYAADSSMETAQGAMKGRVYAAPGKERREMNQGGQKMITIMRQDKKVTWMLMPEQKMYMEMAMDNKSHRSESISDYKIEQTVVGKETVNGVSATKSKVVMTDSKGAKMGGFMWSTPDKIAVKTDVIAMDKSSKMRMKMDLTNLKVGKQDPALFEIPAGYTRMDMGGMMGGARRK